MKNYLLFFLLMFLFFSGCNKQKSVLKNLTGDWTIYSYTFQNNNGLSYKYNTTGTIHFGNCSEDYCSYSLNITYTINGQNYTKNNIGEYQLEKDGEHFIIKRFNSDGSISTFPNNRILLITKDQTKILIQDEFGIHHFVIEK